MILHFVCVETLNLSDMKLVNRQTIKRGFFFFFAAKMHQIENVNFVKLPYFG